MSRFICVLLFYIVSHHLCGQVVFQRSYGGYGSDYGRAVIECSDGGYLVAGSTNSFLNPSTDVYLLRVDEQGEYLWGKNIGLPDKIEWGVDLKEDPEGNFIIAGYTNAVDQNGYDGLLIKTNHEGEVIWQKQFGGPDWDFFESLTLDEIGNAYVAGVKSDTGHESGWLLKINASGNVVWEHLIPGNGKVRITGIDLCTEEVVIFTGYVENTLLQSKTFIAGTITRTGELIWSAGYQELGKLESHGCSCGSNNEILSIGTLFNDDDSQHIHGVSIDRSTGAINWIETIQGYQGIGNSVTQKANGNVFLAGALFGIGFANWSSSINGYNSLGQYVPDNSAIFGGNSEDILYDIIPTADKGLIATGHTQSFGNNYQVHLCKIDSNGAYTPVNFDYLDVTTRMSMIQKPKSFIVYPNPAQSQIMIDLDHSGTFKYQVFSLPGIKCASGQLSSSKRSINIETLNQGVYFLEIQTNDGCKYLSRFMKTD